jgi:signal transduction histidine kinase
MIRFRLLIGFILVGLLPVIGVGIGTYLVSYQNGLQQGIDKLESISARKELSIKVWVQSLVQELEVAAQTDYSPKLVINALNLSNEGTTYTWYNNLVRKRLYYFLERSDNLSELFLMDLSGRVVVSTEIEAENKNYGDFLPNLFESGKTYIELPFEDNQAGLGKGGFIDEEDESNAVVLYLINNENGSHVGWIGGRFITSPLQNILRENTGLGDTGISYLVNWDHRLLKGGVLRKSDHLEEYHFQIVDTDGVNSAMNKGGYAKGIFHNPFNEPVIGVYRWIPELRVVLCVEQNSQEAFQLVSANTKINLVIAFCALIFAVLAGLFMTQSIANPIVNLAHTVERIAHGDLNQSVNVKGNDEVSALANSFNSMTAQLRDLISSLEQRVTERTYDLQRVNEELNQRAIQLETSAKVAREITSILNIDLLLKRVVELIKEAFGYYHVQVFLLEKERNILVLGASSGERYIQHKQLELDGKSINSQAILTGDIQMVNDINTSQYYLYDEGLPETNSELVVPLKVGKKIIGTLDIHDTKMNSFHDKDLLVLQSLADQIAIAIENAQLYNQSRDLAVLEERHRLARELHDSVTQSLYSLVLLTEGWRRILVGNGHNQAAQYLARVGEIASQALKEMRLLILELRPPTLEQEGLIGALQKRLDAVENRVGIKARVIMDEYCNIPISLEKELYWIAQEALNNSLKHANASMVTVRIQVIDKNVVLKVVDDGIGFDLKTVENQGGMGLSNMRERAIRVGGKVTVESSIGEGTIVTAQFPLLETC